MRDLKTVLCRLHLCSQPRYPFFKLCPDCRSDAPHEAVVVEAVVNYFSKPEFRGFFIETEHEIRIGVYTPRPDVVLLDAERNRVAIVECKREGIIDHGIEQLKSYLSASDVQFGIFANSTKPDEWVFFENLRRCHFSENMTRVQFETEIIADQSIESIREEKERLGREVEQADIQLKQHIKQHICLSKKNNFLERDNDRLEIHRNKSKRELEVQREALKKEKEKEKEEWQRNRKKQRQLHADLKKKNSGLDGQIKYKTAQIRELESKVGELEGTLAQQPIYGEIQKELKRLNELESIIMRKQQVARRDQERYAACEQNKVETNQKMQQLVQVSREKESILKQLRVVVNQLKTANPEQHAQIERHREQLVQDLRKQIYIIAQLTTEINRLKEARSRLETEIRGKAELFSHEREEMYPAYVRIQVEIDKLKAEKSKLEAKIGHRIFLLLRKKN